MTVDGKGVPFAGGGLSAGLRDLGRIGLLMLNEGEINDKRLFSSEVVANIREGSRVASKTIRSAILKGSPCRREVAKWTILQEFGLFPDAPGCAKME